MFSLIQSLKNKPKIRLESVCAIHACGVKFRTGCRLIRTAAFVTLMHTMVGVRFAAIMRW